MVGGHQARVGSLQMQYFRALLEHPEEARLRLLYAENARNEAGALRVLATHLLDMKASQAFFGNPTRLQRDILADATTAYIPPNEAAVSFEPR